jgi:hypothetical protein
MHIIMLRQVRKCTNGGALDCTYVSELMTGVVWSCTVVQSFCAFGKCDGSSGFKPHAAAQC